MLFYENIGSYQTFCFAKFQNTLSSKKSKYECMLMKSTHLFYNPSTETTSSSISAVDRPEHSYVSCLVIPDEISNK